LAEVDKYMGILDSLLGIDDTHKINKKEFEERLSEIPELNQKEKEYLKASFEHELKDGLSMNELKAKIYKLEHNFKDSTTLYEIEELKKKLFGELKQK